MKTRFILLFFLLTFRLQAADFTSVPWISISPDLHKPNEWICFRKEFSLGEHEKKAVLRIAVDSKYWLWVNGELVVFEGGLKRGPNPRDTYYDEVDIASFLNPGKNTLAILMWYWGKDGFCHKNSGLPGLLAQLELTDHKIVSDTSWKASVHPAYGETGEPYPNYRLPESNIHFDAGKDMLGWFVPDFDDSAWRQAVVLGQYPCAPWNLLHKRPFPNWLDTGITDYVSVEKTMKNDTLVVTGKLPRNISVTPFIELKAKAGVPVDIRSDNYKGGSEHNVRAEYVTKEGNQSFESFGYINGHAVIYTVPPGADVLRVGYRETRFNTVHEGDFVCNDPFYNKLWQKALNTMNLNMRDAIQDPDRERSQWWGDAVIVSGEMLYSCDSHAHGLIRKAIRNLADWQREDSVLFSPAPAGSWNRELPQQMLAAIGQKGFWNYFMYTGDTATIRDVYPAVKRYMDKWKLDGRNLVIHRPGDWDWCDWGSDCDAAVLDNAWYSLALQSIRNMARLQGYQKEAVFYDKQIKKIKEAVNKYYWNGTVYHSRGYEGKTDDRANGLAVLAGFTDESKWKSVQSFLKEYKNASPYMEKYVLEAFFMQGDIAGGLERMKDRYSFMVDHPLTTLWEDWQIGGAGGGSINHGWAGGPLILLSQYVAGVAPLEPGWELFEIKPATGAFSDVKCTVPTGQGVTKVTIHNDTIRWSLQVENTLPRSFVVAVPKRDKVSSLTVNSNSYPINEVETIKEDEVEFYKSDSEHNYFKVNSFKIDILLQ